MAKEDQILDDNQDDDTLPEDAALNMSDEDFLANGHTLLVEEPAAGDDTQAGADANDTVTGDDTAAGGENDDTLKGGEGDDTVAGADKDKGQQQPGAAAQPAKAEGQPGAAEAGKTPDYEGFYKKLTSTFKANGKDMKIDNPDDAIRLMQMGANYNRKMADMKPGLKVLKLLQANNLLDEGRLNFLIDIEKKDPKAIAKLVKEAGINPLELDVQNDNGYTPTVRTVNDKELELDSVLDDVKHSPNYSKLLTVVTKQWDAASQKEIAASPQVLKVIESHMASGVFDLITTALEHDRSLGKFVGPNDLAAYKQMGDAINARGGFDHLFQPKPEQQAPNQAVAAPAKKPDAKEANRNAQRRAAGATRTSETPNKKGGDFNPLNMSDEAFAKEIASKLL